jgi:class 3 adenylate cyclase
MRNLPTGTITLLFSDIEGSTHLFQQLGDVYADVLTKCRHLLRMAFRVYLGQEVDSQGDAFFVVFTWNRITATCVLRSPGYLNMPGSMQERQSRRYACVYPC